MKIDYIRVFQWWNTVYSEVTNKPIGLLV
jgi:hypothetical protein